MAIRYGKDDEARDTEAHIVRYETEEAPEDPGVREEGEEQAQVDAHGWRYRNDEAREKQDKDEAD
jgi:hypothetical protein